MNGSAMRKPLFTSAVALTCGLILTSVAALPASAAEGSVSDEFVANLTAAAAQGDLEAADTLRDYESLSASEEAQFNQALEALASGDVEPSDVAGVEIIDESGSSPAAPVEGARVGRAAATASWSAYCTQRVSLLGVVVTETRVDADFDTGGGKVTGIRNQRARVVTNFQPLTNVEFKEIRKETGTIGTVRALVRVERGPIKGLGSQTENWQSLAVNGSGKVTSCRWGY